MVTSKLFTIPKTNNDKISVRARQSYFRNFIIFFDDVATPSKQSVVSGSFALMSFIVNIQSEVNN